MDPSIIEDVSGHSNPIECKICDESGQKKGKISLDILKIF
jgi:hypothetical protein